VGIPIVALAELTFGAYKSQRRDANLERIAALRRSITVLNLDDGIVDLYGSTRAALERRGIVKSDFDLLILCTALRQDAVLVTTTRGCSMSRSTDCVRPTGSLEAPPSRLKEQWCGAF